MSKAILIIAVILLAALAALLICVIIALRRIMGGTIRNYQIHSGKWSAEEVKEYLKECYTLGKKIDHHRRWERKNRRSRKPQQSGNN